jgi:hypothetical protein
VSGTVGKYYNITNSGFTGVSLPTPSPTTPVGAFWVLRNNTNTYLSIIVTNNSNISTPQSLAPYTSITIAINGTGGGTAYTIF